MTVRAAAPGRVYIPPADRHDGIHRAPMEQPSSTRPWEEIAMGMGRMMSSMTDKREGDVTKAIESATAAIPSGTFLTFAVGAMAASLLLMLSGRKNVANFIGQWAPTILIMGLYNKTVKQHGSD